jgi:hypothetical protein
MESDDRVVGVVKQVDDALAELDKMDLMIGLYKTQLNVRIILPRPFLLSSFFASVPPRGRHFLCE